MAFFATLVSAICFALVIGSANARAAACDTSWAAPVDGDWNDPANWSNGLPGGGNPNACIDLPGDYTVQVGARDGDLGNATATASHLVLGGPSGEQSLELTGATLYNSPEDHQLVDAVLDLDSAVVGPNGRLALDDTGFPAYLVGAPGATIEVPGGLVNEGTIDVDPGVGGERRIHGPLANGGTVSLPNRYTSSDGARSGKLDVDGDYSQTASGSLLVEANGANEKYDAHFSHLGVSGSAEIDGSLSVRTAGGSPGQRFPIVAAGDAVDGTFSALSVAGEPPVDVEYGGNTVDLVVGSAAADPVERLCSRAHSRLRHARALQSKARATHNRHWRERARSGVRRARHRVSSICL